MYGNVMTIKLTLNVYLFVIFYIEPLPLFPVPASSIYSEDYVVNKIGRKDAAASGFAETVQGF
jgi:hypothetical protein